MMVFNNRACEQRYIGDVYTVKVWLTRAAAATIQMYIDCVKVIAIFYERYDYILTNEP